MNKSVNQKRDVWHAPRGVRALASLLLIAIGPSGLTQIEPLAARTDYRNEIFTNTPTFATNTSLGQPASVAFFSGNIGALTNELPSSTALVRPNDGTYYLLQSIIGQPVGVAAVPFELFTNGSGTITPSPDMYAATNWYQLGQTVQLTARPGRYYAFQRWQDSVTSTQRTVTVGLSDSYTAFFTNTLPLETLNILGTTRIAPSNTPWALFDNVYYPNNIVPATNGRLFSVQLNTTYSNGIIKYTTDGTTDPIFGTTNTGAFNLSAPFSLRMVALDHNNANGQYADPINTLSATTLGGGGVAVSSDTDFYNGNNSARLTATPAAGWTFMNWTNLSDNRSDTNAAATLLVDGPKEVQAVFGTKVMATASVGGYVTNIPTLPSFLYPYGSVVRLAAVPWPGTNFDSWAGGFIGGNVSPVDFTVTVTNPTITANFGKMGNQRHSLTVLTFGEGDVTNDPPRQAQQYRNGYQSTDFVTNFAIARAGNSFLGWGGDTNGAATQSNGDQLTLLMDSDRLITASFAPTVPTFAFTSQAYEVNEADLAITLTVTNFGARGTNVSFSTRDGTAFGGNGTFADYITNSGVITFTNGPSSRTITIGIREQYLRGPDKTFQVILSNPGTGGRLGTPTNAIVTIHYNDALTTDGSLLVQAYPEPPPEMTGSLQMFLDPVEASGQWRFPWQLGWRTNAEIATNLAAGSYDVEFQEVPSYLAIPKPGASIANGTPALATNVYYPTLGPLGLGSFKVRFFQNQPAGAAWRFRGESEWHDLDYTASGLLPGSRIVEFATLAGYAAPPAQPFEITTNFVFGDIDGNYVQHSLPSGVRLPAPLSNFAQINLGAADLPRLPYVFNGQLWSPTNGFASGVAVRANVVLTAAHVVFDFKSLSYKGPIYWFFQQQKAEFEPAPQKVHGWKVLSGYASARALDTNGPASRNLDVAALYFTSAATRGGFGGYLASDLSPNPWLTSTNRKMLVGYPSEASADGYTNVVVGKMHSTLATNLTFSLQNGSVYASSNFLNFPGNSGGPLYVQHPNGLYYPAAICLGRQGEVSLVRAIDSNVVSLIIDAELSGDIGTNNTSGGVLTFVSDLTLSSNNPAYVQVIYGPTTLLARGGWRVQGDDSYGTNSTTRLYTRSITNNDAVVEFRNVPGWDPPPGQTFQLIAGKQNIISNQFYTLAATQSVSSVSIFNASGYAGGPFNPPITNTYTITNSGQGSLIWSVIPSTNWLSAAPPNGVLAGFRKTNVTVSLAAPAYSLPAGLHAASLIFTNQTNNLGTDFRSVTLNLSAHPPVLLTNAYLGNDGSLTLNVVGLAGANYALLCTTNLGLPITNWTLITNVMGPATVTLPAPPDAVERFYRAKEL